MPKQALDALNAAATVDPGRTWPRDLKGIFVNLHATKAAHARLVAHLFDIYRHCWLSHAVLASRETTPFQRVQPPRGRWSSSTNIMVHARTTVGKKQRHLSASGPAALPPPPPDKSRSPRRRLTCDDLFWCLLRRRHTMDKGWRG